MAKRVVVGFCCNECSYAAADLAGSTHRHHPGNVLIVRVPCTGIVEPAWILYALAQGADAVFVAGCRRDECHYIDGNLKAEERVKFVKQLLRAVGLEEERVEMFFIAASEPQRFVEAATLMAKRAESLPPMEKHLVEALGKREMVAESLRAIARKVEDLPLPRLPGFEAPNFGDRCTGCRACVEACSYNALSWSDADGYRLIMVNAGKCVGCGDCVEACVETGEKAVEIGGLTVKMLLEEWTTAVRLELARCQRCGEFFATFKELEKASSKPVCPRCKAELSAGAIAMGRVRG